MLQQDGALCGCPGSMLLHLKSSCNTHHKLLLWSVGPNCHGRNQNSFEKSPWLLAELVTLFSQHFSPGAHLSTALLPKSQPQSLCHTSLLTWGLLTVWTPQSMTTNGCSRSKRAASRCACYTAPLRGNLVAVRPPWVVSSALSLLDFSTTWLSCGRREATSCSTRTSLLSCFPEGMDKGVSVQAQCLATTLGPGWRLSYTHTNHAPCCESI